MIETIGTNAGLVWRALDESGKALTVKELKSVTKLRTEREVNLALGWLAKEGKVDFDTTEKEFTVSLRK